MNLYVDFKRHTSITISQYWRHLCVTDQRDNFSRSLYSWTSLGRSKNCPLLAISKNAGLSYFHCLMFQTVCHGYNKQTNKQKHYLHDCSFDLISCVVHVEGKLGPDPARVLNQTDSGTVRRHVQRVDDLQGPR